MRKYCRNGVTDGRPMTTHLFADAHVIIVCNDENTDNMLIKLQQEYKKRVSIWIWTTEYSKVGKRQKEDSELWIRKIRFTEHKYLVNLLSEEEMSIKAAIQDCVHINNVTTH